MGRLSPVAVGAATLIHGAVLAALALNAVPTPLPVSDPAAITLEVVPGPSPPPDAGAAPEVAEAPPLPETAANPAPASVPPVAAPVLPATRAPPHAARRPTIPAPHARAAASVEPAASLPPAAADAPEAAAPPAPAPISPAWQAVLSAWLQAHKTYPEAAREAGEQGTATTRFTVSRDGRVRSVEIVQGSGSPVLDLAAGSLLRDAQVPPFPSGMTQPEVTVTVRIRYAIER